MTESKGIAEKIEEASGAVIIAEPDDPQSLGALDTILYEISQLVPQDSQDILGRAVLAAENIVKNIILGEEEDGVASLQTVAKTISSLQEIVRDGREVDAVIFPEELGLSKDQGKDSSTSNFNLPGNVDEEIFSEFLTQQNSVMEEMEKEILALEKKPDSESMSNLKRILHTLKGEAGVLGLSDVGQMCHETEGYIESKGNEISLDKLLEVKDWFLQFFNACAGKGSIPMKADEMLLQLFSEENLNNLPSPSRDESSTEMMTESGEETENNVKEEEPGEKLETKEGENEIAAAQIAAEQAAEKEAEAKAVEEKVEEQAETKEGVISDSKEEKSDTVLHPFGDATSACSLVSADPELFKDFIVEAKEHLDSADLNLLTLETESDDEALNSIFRSFHTIKGVAGFLELKEIGQLAHESETLLDKARKGEIVFSGKAVDLIFTSVDRIKQYIDNLEKMLSKGEPLVLDESLNELLASIRDVVSGKADEIKIDSVSSPAEGGKKVGEILVEEGMATETDIMDALQKQKDREPPKLGQLLVEKNQVSAQAIAQALRKQKRVKIQETLKVDTDRLDRMIDTIGELVIVESMVANNSEILGIASERVGRDLRQLGKITRELQEMGMSMRMIPLRSTFQKMARLVRDLAKKSNKNINFTMSGEDTELDKGVVEKISDPLIHMVRNAVDHGMESSPAERKSAGKPEIGRIELRGFHKGGKIHIEIEDDGRGLDREAIIAKAERSGIIQDGNSMTDREVFNLIFRPGFSTAEKVTDISGRGVGMDVVRRNIESLRGEVEIDSMPKKGSIFRIQLPLTLAIIDGMVVVVGKERYIVPTLSVVESIRPAKNEVSRIINKGELFSMRGQLIPLFRISRLFNLENAEDDPSKALVVVVEDGGKKIGLMVDNLLGQQQTVIKNLGPVFDGITGVSGGAIMANGQVGIILDVAGIVRMATNAG